MRELVGVWWRDRSGVDERERCVESDSENGAVMLLMWTSQSSQNITLCTQLTPACLDKVVVYHELVLHSISLFIMNVLHYYYFYDS